MSLRNGKKLGADKLLLLVVPPVKESMRKKHLVSSRKPIKQAGTIKKKPDNAENYTFVQSLKPASNDGRPEAGTERSLAFRAELLELGGQSVYPSAEICPTDPPMEWSPPHSPNWPRAPSPEYFPMEPTYSPVSPPSN